MKTLRGLLDGLRGEHGFSLAEVLMATAMLIVGVAVALSALMYGVAGVEGSRGQSTAVFPGRAEAGASSRLRGQHRRGAGLRKPEWSRPGGSKEVLGASKRKS